MLRKGSLDSVEPIVEDSNFRASQSILHRLRFSHSVKSEKKARGTARLCICVASRRRRRRRPARASGKGDCYGGGAAAVTDPTLLACLARLRLGQGFERGKQNNPREVRKKQLNGSSWKQTSRCACVA